MQIPDKAFWIGSDHAFDLQETYLNFRRDVAFDTVPKCATLAITADSRYLLWVNGVYVCRGPARCWPHAQQVDELDIAPFLKSGENCIAVQVYSPGYSHFAHVHRAACGLLAWLEADDKTALVTDQTWQVRRDHSWDQMVPRVSIYGSGVERRTLDQDDDWQADPLSVGDWRTPRIVSPPNGPIWSGLRPRDVPMLEEDKVPLERLFQFRLSQFIPNFSDPHQALREVFTNSAPQAAPEVPAEIHAGQSAIWIFDLGSSQTGVAVAHLDGLQGGETLLVSYAEKLRDGELVICDPATYCRMRPTDVFALRSGAQTVEGFSQRGGRYLIFALHAPATVRVTAAFFFRRTRYKLAEKARAVTDPALAKIADLCRATTLNCLQDGFVDSVWRESSQWLGDCVAQAYALSAISDDAGPLRRVIMMAAEGAYADGILPSVLPGEVHAYVVTDYNFSWIELLDMHRTHPGAGDGDALARSLLPVMDRVLTRFRDDIDGGGLLISQPGRRLFLDWSGVDRREPNLTYNGRYLEALRRASSIARAVGADGLATRCAEQADSLATAMRRAFRAAGGWRETPFGTPATQLGLALALLTGLMDAEEAGAAADAISARSLDLDDSAHATGKLVLASPFMHHYVFQALEASGRPAAILDIIRARWGRWAEAGEATVWENWAIDFPDGSCCHGFSAHPLGWIARLAGEQIQL